MGAAQPLSAVAVALDTSDRATYRRWCRLFGPRVGALKVGLEAFARWGPAAVEEAAGHAAAVFLDLKLHDIPNTVAGAVAAARDLGVRYLTVHAGGGPAMLRAAEAAAEGRVALLAVTVLTHLDAAALAALDLPGGVAARVERWADLAAAAGCAGVVCSPQEVAALRRRHPRPFVLVTPGVRPASAAADDQRRTATPAEALAAGSDLLVVGRPLTQAADPEAALEALAVELAGAAPAGG
jgi:orotidine-5'-phosphate decarboxylase